LNQSPPASICVAVIAFIVSVPVLSELMTVVPPRVSTSLSDVSLPAWPATSEAERPCRGGGRRRDRDRLDGAGRLPGRRALGAARVVLAVPVAPPGWRERMRHDADELVCVQTRDRSPPSGSSTPTSPRRPTMK
jgi:hypothetical protein